MESFHSHDKKSIVNVSSSKKAALSKQLTLASGRGILQSTQRDRTGIARARARVRAIVWTSKCPFWLCDCILTILLPFFCYHLFFNIPTKGSSVEEGVALFHVYRSKYNRTTYFKASTQVFIHAQICVHVWDTSSMDISVGSVLHVVFFGRFPVWWQFSCACLLIFTHAHARLAHQAERNEWTCAIRGAVDRAKEKFAKDSRTTVVEHLRSNLALVHNSERFQVKTQQGQDSRGSV